MGHSHPNALLVGCLIVMFGVGSVSGSVSVAAAAPPRPGTTDSGLTEDEEATLWANMPAEWWDVQPGADTTVHELAAETDLTFTKPPDTAHRWNRYAHEQFEPGGRDVSVHPAGIETYSHDVIKDAHASIFAVNPSTRVFVSPDDQRHYVAPNGTLRGAVDYRIELPSETNRRSYRLLEDDIEEVRLYVDGERVETAPGTATPEFDYELGWSDSKLRLEAKITATVEETVRPPPGSNRSASVYTHDVWLETSSWISVDVYDFEPSVTHAEYPNGDTGLSIAQPDPWQGYTLDASGDRTIRGIWRFFTARSTEWQRLVATSSTETKPTESHALPVYVYAYPSSMQPRAKPTFDGPQLLDTWGSTHETPAGALPENVTAEVVEDDYTETYGMAIRDTGIDPDEVRMHGIVYGTTTLPRMFYDEPRRIHEAALSATVIEETDDAATVRLTLEDAETGDPITLQTTTAVPVAQANSGYIELGDNRVRTDEDGQITVRLTDPGVYTARYEPTPWFNTRTAYAGDSATVQYAPLADPMTWLDIAIRLGVILLPFGVAWYAGKRLADVFRLRRRR